MQRIAIVQGQHAIADDPDTIITTLLGSCIAVCLHDAEAKLGGMNHFLLGEPEPQHRVRPEDRHRYGLHAMELLINAMMQKGAARHRLRAHVFGGANVVPAFGKIGTANGEFALRFLGTEGIAIGHCALGGILPRKVEFRPWDGTVHTSTIEERFAPPPRPSAAPQVQMQGSDMPDEYSHGDVELFR
ncbi:chemotaxis protein CheD [Sphingobium subterraneum]|uniref:Probable chemoreceptor glutamine deamidase CheD n=1 Tax=Sphingobium subterraneum TaxID=627688 RepID=A0A841J0R6_9SPHN|nr:chemotaxis protein CheD [Sphingobium subterraneum]MBB6124304.1 chemotaxis protein CheD [Sphingobium subterraneum]